MLIYALDSLDLRESRCDLICFCGIDSLGLDSSRYRAQNDKVEYDLDTSLRISNDELPTRRHTEGF